MAYRTGLGRGRGDPGLGSILRKVGSGVARVAGAVLPGPAGALARVAQGALRGAPTVAAAATGVAAIRSIAMPGGAVPSLPQLARSTTRNVREFATSALSGEACPKGFHLNKSGYYTAREGYIPPRSKCVRNRARNNANGRALRRAVGRVQGFNRLVKSSRKSLKALASI